MSVGGGESFFGINGQIVTGRLPVKLVVCAPDGSGSVMNSYQNSMVERITRAFLVSVTMSAFPNGFHSADHVLPDGTQVSIYSNGPTRRVMVTVPNPTGYPIPYHGIGVAFTDMSDNAVLGWLIQVAYNLTEPQPIVLVPRIVPKSIPPVASGEWDIVHQKKLIGGQQLWVSEDRTKWFSNFRSPIGSGEVLTGINPGPGKSKPYVAWVSLVGGYDALTVDGETAVYRAACIMSQNRVNFLRTSADGLSDTPMFMLGSNLAYIQIVDPSTLRLHQGPAPLSTPDLDSASSALSSAYFTPSSTLTITLAPTQNAGSAVTIHPSGKKAILRTQRFRTSPTNSVSAWYDDFIELSMVEKTEFVEAAFTYTQGVIANDATTSDFGTVLSGSGGATKTLSRAIGGYFVSDCAGGTTGWEYVSGSNFTSYATGNHHNWNNSTSTSFGGMMYAANGDKVPWSTVQTSISNAVSSNSASTIISVALAPNGGVLSSSETSTGTKTSTHHASLTVSTVFPKRAIPTETTEFTSFVTVDGTSSYAGTAKTSTSKILFYDHVTDLLVTLDDDATTAVTGAGTGPDPVGQAYSTSYAGLPGERNIYISVVGAGGFTRRTLVATDTASGLAIFKDPSGFPAPPGPPSTNTGYISASSIVLGDFLYAQYAGFDAMENFTYTPFNLVGITGSLQCPDQTVAYTAGVDASHYEFTGNAWAVQSGVENGITWKGMQGVSAVGSTTQLISATNVYYARDPVTLAVLVNVRVTPTTGAERSLWYAATEKNVKTLHDILNENNTITAVNTTMDLKSWKEASLNSPVSI
jgi:hypothetical protein